MTASLQGVRLGAQPIIWSNDDFHDLGGDTPLEACLSEMRQAGYVGTELGHKYPREPLALKRVLERHGLVLASGWHSSYVLTRSWQEECAEWDRHLDLLQGAGASVAIVAECSYRNYDQPTARLRGPDEPNGLTDAQWRDLASGLERLAVRARERGMVAVYHHHMGTVVQTEAEIRRLMRETRELSLLFDTGHLAFAGAEPRDVLEEWLPRIRHVHLKNVRRAVVRDAVAKGWSFAQAVRAGVFTVPGDGGIDYAPLLTRLAEAHYQGWMVVEAEQDPKLAPPIVYARLGREYLARWIPRT